MLERIKNVIATFKGMDEGTLEALRYTLLFFIVIDLFLFYWWMGWKTLAMGLMVVTIIFLTIIMFLEKRLRDIEYYKKQDRVEEIENRLKQLKGG